MEQLLLIDKCGCKSCSKWVYFNENKMGFCEKHYLRFYLAKHNKKEREKLRRQKAKLNPINRIRLNLRNRIKKLLKKYPNQKSSKIGCTGIELRNYLEQKFTPEMSWENYGKAWHVDHIKPLSKFNLLDVNDLMEANHFRNLQPLTAKDNLKKGNKYESN